MSRKTRTDVQKGPVAKREAPREAKAAWHREQARLPLKEKVRILLDLQKQDYELLKRHRKLKWYEKPWDVEP